MADMFIWILGGALKQKRQDGSVASAQRGIAGAVASTKLTSEQAYRLGQFAFQFLH